MRRSILLGAACLVAFPVTARADVFAIGAGGAVSVRSGNGGVLEIGAPNPANDGVGNDDITNEAEPVPDVPTAALTTIGPPTAPPLYQDALAQAAAQAKVSPTLLAALVWQESRWHAAALSPKGAFGLTQLMPATARGLAVDRRDIAANLRGGAQYLRHLLDMFDGNVERALAAYNAGPGRVLRAGGIPAITETRSYVSAIIDRLASGAPALSGGSTR